MFSSKTHGQGFSRIMVVGESSHKSSIDAGKYYAVNSLRAILSDVLNLDKECYLTDLIKCDKAYMTAKNNLEKAAENCSQFLVREIELVKPKLIVTVGELPFCYLTEEKGFWSGRQDDGRGCKYNGILVVPMVHPSHGTEHYGKKPWQKRGYWDSIRGIFVKALEI